MAGKKRAVISHHEAGHAVIARKLGVGVAYATARAADAVASIHSAAWQSADADLATQILAFEKDTIVALAGIAAQRHHQGTEGIHSLLDDDADMVIARSAIYKIVCLRTGKPVPSEPGDRRPGGKR
jgi:hypothetical protein